MVEKTCENAGKCPGRKLVEKAGIKWLEKEAQNSIKKLERKAAKVEETKVERSIKSSLRRDKE